MAAILRLDTTSSRALKLAWATDSQGHRVWCEATPASVEQTHDRRCHYEIITLSFELLSDSRSVLSLP